MFSIGVDKDKSRRKRRPKDPYRHIEVKEQKGRGHVTVTVRCPTNYPGLTEVERRRMYEGLAMVADAFRDADERCEHEHNRRSQ